MENNYCLMMVATATMLAASCSTNDDYFDDYVNNQEIISPIGGSSSAGGTATTAGELTTFDIVVDSTAMAETETFTEDDEDYVENNSFSSTVYINYNGSTASYRGSVDGVSVTIDGADVIVTSVAKGVNYVLSGSTNDGMFKMASGDDNKKFQLTLNGVNIRNNDGPAINIQVGKRCYVTLADNTFNTLTDGTSYSSSGEDQKATLFSEGELLFNGSGKLRIYSNAKNGICSDDYILFRPGNDIYVMSTSSNCIKANDGIYIKGGVINCETTAKAGKGLKTDSVIVMDGGRVTAITTGDGEYDSDDNDVNGAAGVKADYSITINGGELLCKSTGKGGKGVSTDQEFNVLDGTVKVITTGSTYSYGSYSTKAKGIKADGNITISGGSVMVRATGDNGSEGIESKKAITINGGSVEVYSYDDAVNSAYDLTLNGGYTYVYAVNNDGLDANHHVYIKGGTTVAYGTSQPECGIDANEEQGYSVIVTGGTLVGIGGGTSYPSSSSTQPSMVFGGSVSSGSTIALNSGDSNVLSLEMGRSYNGSACFLITSPNLKKGSSYTLYNGASATGTDWHGLIASAKLGSTGTSVASVSSLNSPYSTCGSSTGGIGGMGGGIPGRH